MGSPAHLSLVLLLLVTTIRAQEPGVFVLNREGGHRFPGQPESSPLLMVIGGKPLRLELDGLPETWNPRVSLSRNTATRRVPLSAEPATFEKGKWRFAWTPPATKGPVRYEIRFEGTPSRNVHIELRDPEWVSATIKTLAGSFQWEASGMTADERKALSVHGIRTAIASASTEDAEASLQMIPKEGAGPRRRVTWSQEEPSLVVWSAGPNGGDVEVRAPRWWIRPEALATDQGLIRILDLFSEPQPMRNQP